MSGSQHGLFPDQPPAAGDRRFTIDLSRLPPTLLVGTSSFSTGDWRGVFYPAEAPPGDYLRHYASQFRTVEIDATFYAIPSAQTVRGWYRKTPEDWNSFLGVMEQLGEKLGPLPTSTAPAPTSGAGSRPSPRSFRRAGGSRSRCVTMPGSTSPCWNSCARAATR